MSYFEFGFPVPEAPQDPATEFCFIRGKAHPLGPYMPISESGERVCERERQKGFYHRSGHGTYAPTWLAVLRAYPTLRAFLTSPN